MKLAKRLEVLIDLYESVGLPSDELTEMCQYLLDTGLNEELTQYTQLCEYMILEGMCYDVPVD